MSKKVKERVAGKQLADVMIELSAKILKLEEDLGSEIFYRKADADEIDRLKGQVATAVERANKANIEAAQANIAAGKARTELKDWAEKCTAAKGDLLTARGRIVDLQAEAVVASEKYLKADADAREAWKMSSNYEGALSVSRADIARLNERLQKAGDACDHAHGLYVQEMKLKEKALRELRKLKKARR